MLDKLNKKEKAISVTGLGYVGLPLALELARNFKVIGFDINPERIGKMKNKIDPSEELESSAFDGCDITFTSNPLDLQKASFHIISVPTDIDENRVPNLTPLFKASQSIGKILQKGDYVVYESTVYPGCTDEDCVPILEKHSGLSAIKDFKYGFSPERINPGDKVRTLTTITKVVSGCDEESLKIIASVYSSIIQAGIHKAPTIKVAEAAKIIENTQRDINIALMNELAMFFDKMNIDTKEVLEAANTKWNFLNFFPGLVGGHCIGVDPYYLTYKAQQIGYTPKMIMSSRRINEELPSFVAKKIVQTLLELGKNPSQCKLLCMGVTFKEDVSDIRNSKVTAVIKELMDYSIEVHLTDPLASSVDLKYQYNLQLTEELADDYDAILVAVGHKEYKAISVDDLVKKMNDKPALFDLKGIFHPSENLIYWRL